MYQVLERKNGLPPKIFFTSTISEDVFLVITKSVKGIQESVAVANEFYLASGIVMIVVGIIAVLYLSRKISDPIIKMNHIARDMRNLKFGEKIEITSNDEIGELAISINLLSDKLSNSIRSLQEDIEERKVLVRDISHELKTPIAVIKGYVEGLKYNVAEDEQTKEKYYDVIVDECDRINELIKELLELSKLEGVSSELQVLQVSIKKLIHESIEKFQHIADMRSVEIRFTCEEDVLTHVDEHLMERVIINLLSNAIKYANSPGYVRINLKGKNQGCELSVFNSGENIPEESLEQIFNVFYKVDQVRGRDNEGHGIGLAIVKRIMDMHKGTYSVKNESKGVTFTIWIPNLSSKTNP
ncbi:MAG TPA: sensor histidine kinase [Lachnospiraceae bacterium]|nr:sensor histidine kinase [Lachnospiraceae bacterium]